MLHTGLLNEVISISAAVQNDRTYNCKNMIYHFTCVSLLCFYGTVGKILSNRAIIP